MKHYCQHLTGRFVKQDAKVVFFLNEEIPLKCKAISTSATEAVEVLWSSHYTSIGTVSAAGGGALLGVSTYQSYMSG